jgi:DNA-binding Xre family transcriptional regulator
MLPLQTDEPPPTLDQINIWTEQKKRKKMDAVGIEPTTIHKLKMRSEYCC